VIKVPCHADVIDPWRHRWFQHYVFTSLYLYRLFIKGSRYVRRRAAYWFELEEVS
jgi:hypothetical protein